MEDNKYECYSLIDPTEFQSNILDYIYSDEFNKHFSVTSFNKSKDEYLRNQCKQAMVHGMVIASLMTSKCKLIHVVEDNDHSNMIKDFSNGVKLRPPYEEK